MKRYLNNSKILQDYSFLFTQHILYFRVIQYLRKNCEIGRTSVTRQIKSSRAPPCPRVPSCIGQSAEYGN